MPAKELLDVELRIRISREMRRRLRIAAANEDMTVSRLVRRILEEWVKKKPKMP